MTAPIFMLNLGGQTLSHVMITRQKGGKELLKIVNVGLDELKSDGYYQRVFEKYGIPFTP